MPLITVSSPPAPPVTYRFDGDRVSVGRGPENDLVLHETSVSRRHVEFARDEGGWRIVDLDSRNGTRLNGRPVLVSVRLTQGDRIGLGTGATVLVFDAEVEGAVREGAELAAQRETVSERGAVGGEGAPELVGRSESIERLRESVAAVAPSDEAVLLLGESGTGKELVARLIHHHSSRRDGPFVVLNCPAVPRELFEAELFGVERGVATGVEERRGLLEAAEGGTLLLDEIGDLDPGAQAKVLRFLQDRSVQRLGAREAIILDVRLLAATHHDLEADIETGTFRRDLFHRLNVVTLTLPPLRERLDDLPLLVEHVLGREGGPSPRLSAEALALLQGHSWPGNVRELEGVLRSARLFARESPEIRPEHLPSALRDPRPASLDLYRRLVVEGGSFWDVVHGPFTRRELTREAVRALVERGHREAGGSYKRMCALFGVEDPTEYKKVLDFLRNNDVRVRD